MVIGFSLVLSASVVSFDAFWGYTISMTIQYWGRRESVARAKSFVVTFRSRLIAGERAIHHPFRLFCLPFVGGDTIIEDGSACMQRCKGSLAEVEAIG